MVNVRDNTEIADMVLCHVGLFYQITTSVTRVCYATDRMKKLVLTALVLLLSATFGGQAAALSCAPPEASPDEIVSAREYIFYGKALATDTKDQTVRLQVTRVIRGDLGDEVTLRGTMWGTYSFEDGVENLLLFKRQQYDASTATFQKIDCDFYDSISPSQQDFPVFAALVDKHPETKGSNWVPFTIGGAAVATLGVAAFWRSRRPLKRRR